MYKYNLIDGFIIDGSIIKSVQIKPLSDSDKEEISQIVDLQFQALLSSDNFNPVNEKHTQSIKGLLLLNEHAAASVSSCNEQQVALTYSDLCNLKLTALDWNIILTASMAVDELHNGEKAEMLA
ncbi:hypothetical protein VB525_05705 [Vibrio parahaemolyticus]|uniref:hypothetical protein n=1 Tax=Vibrio parahaemolyticus TaxID=670 RepID=UPI002B1F843D|nr:hypothetical protein [Vibrio parahaemolyticus]MEA5313392.1 hypothetical protein [Vibrio parahaemolyticus]